MALPACLKKKLKVKEAADRWTTGQGSHMSDGS